MVRSSCRYSVWFQVEALSGGTYWSVGRIAVTEECCCGLGFLQRYIAQRFENIQFSFIYGTVYSWIISCCCYFRKPKLTFSPSNLLVVSCLNLKKNLFKDYLHSAIQVAHKHHDEDKLYATRQTLLLFTIFWYFLFEFLRICVIWYYILEYIRYQYWLVDNFYLLLRNFLSITCCDLLPEF